MRKLFILLVVIAAALAGGAYWLSGAGTKAAEDKFELAQVQFGNLTETIGASGIFHPRDVVPVGSEVPGRVVKLYPDADFNHRVEKGQPLLELDRSVAELKLKDAEIARTAAQNNVAQAKAAYSVAKAGFSYAKKLQQQNVAPEPEFLKAQHQLDEAEAAVKLAGDKLAEAENTVATAQLALDKLTVKSPLTGTVLDRKVAVGQLIGPPLSAHLFTIAEDMSKMHLHAQVAEGDVSRVRVGQKANISVYAYSQTDYKPTGTVKEIRLLPPQNPATAAGAVFYDTVIEVDNQRDPDKAWMLLPGMTADVQIIRRVDQNVWKMPIAALNLTLDEHYQSPEARAKLARIPSGWDKVWIVRNNRPWPIFVLLKRESGEPGTSNEGFQEVTKWDPEIASELKPGEPSTYPDVIIGAPPVKKSGFLDQLKFKI